MSACLFVGLCPCRLERAGLCCMSSPHNNVPCRAATLLLGLQGLPAALDYVTGLADVTSGFLSSSFFKFGENNLFKLLILSSCVDLHSFVGRKFRKSINTRPLRCLMALVQITFYLLFYLFLFTTVQSLKDF